MKKKHVFASAIIISLLIITSCGSDTNDIPDDGLKIDGFSPIEGPVGTRVWITGQNFGSSPSVKIGALDMIIDGNTKDNEVFAFIPDGAETGKISVTIDGDEVKSTNVFTVTEEVTGPDAIELAETTLEMRTLDTVEFPEITNLQGFGNSPAIIYASDNSSFVEVDEEGNITAIQAGETEVTVSIGTLTATVDVNVDASIFVGGYTDKNDGEYSVATVWTNGKAFELSDVSSSKAFIAVEGPNLYATHVEYSLDDTRPIKVYKNNSLYGTVGNVDNNNRAPKAIQVVGDDIYICGFEMADGTQYAKYWKSGQETILSHEGNSASAESMLIKDNSVYVSGSGYTNTHIAKYWVNGDPTEIGMVSSFANDIFVDDLGEIFTVGEEDDIAKIWKNTEVLYQLDDGINSTVAFSVTVYQNDVFAVGADYTAGKGKFWINGEMASEWAGSAVALTEYGGFIYIAGRKYDAVLDKNTATVWKMSPNGELVEEINLPNDQEDTHAASIVVK